MVVDVRDVPEVEGVGPVGRDEFCGVQVAEGEDLGGQEDVFWA